MKCFDHIDPVPLRIHLAIKRRREARRVPSFAASGGSLWLMRHLVRDRRRAGRKP